MKKTMELPLESLVYRNYRRSVRSNDITVSEKNGTLVVFYPGSWRRSA